MAPDRRDFIKGVAVAGAALAGSTLTRGRAEAVSMSAHGVIAAADAPASIKAETPYVCDGVADQVQINQAIADCGKPAAILLFGREFELSGPIVCRGQVETFGLGKHVTRLNASSSWSPRSGTGLFTLADRNQDAVVIHDLCLQGRARPNLSGIWFDNSSPTDQSTWVDSPDAIHNIYEMHISGFTAGHAVRITGVDSRACKVHDIRMEDGDPVIYADVADSFFANLDIHGGVDGAIFGVQAQVVNVKSWFNSRYGFVVETGRGQYSNCFAQDNGGHGWYITAANNTFSACAADGSGRTTANQAGWYVASNGNTFAACQSYDKSTPANQAYGVQWVGTVTRTIMDMRTYDNAMAAETGTRPSDAQSRIFIANG